MSSRPRLSDEERRRRLAVRHGLAPGFRFGSVEAAVAGMGALHATDHSTVHLSAWARVAGYVSDDLDSALGEGRTLVKQPAMRNTLFVTSRERLPHLLGSASARIAGPEERRLAKALVASGVSDDPVGWLASTSAAVTAALAGGAMTPAELRAAVPAMDVRVNVAPGTKWGRDLPSAQYVLSVLTARGVLVRAVPRGPWYRSQPTYAAADRWWPEPVRVSEAETGYREVVADWLRAFGPATSEDLVWWLGSTKSAARSALVALAAVEVDLEGGETGWVLPDDTDETPDPGEWAALLPILDPTTMGWRGRGFYLDAADVPYLVDSVGNASTTAWVNGHVVGCWVQGEGGAIRVVPRRPLTARESELLDAEVERLDAFVAGDNLGLTYNTPQSQGLRLN